MKFHRAVLVLSTIAVFPFGAAALTYSVTLLGDTFSHGIGVNERGQVSGQARFPGGVHAFRYDGGTMMDLGTLFGGTAAGADINLHGHVTGTETLGSPLMAEAFVFDGTSLRGLGTLGGSFSNGFAINDSGQVTGGSTIAFDADVHAFLYDGAGLIDLGTIGGTHSYGYGINSSGQVTGYSSTPVFGQGHAFLYDGSTMTDLGTLGGNHSWGYDINDYGLVTGYSYTAAVEHRAFLHDGSTMLDLGTLGGDRSYGNGINNLGQVVGRSNTASGTPHAFLYDSRLGGMVDLNEYIDPSSGWVLSTADDISTNGYITGNGLFNGQRRAFLLTPIPEPGTLTLLAIGLAGLAGARRRKTPQ